MDNDSASQRYKFTFVLLLTLATLGLFLTIIQAFVLDILLACIFAGMLVPFFKRVYHGVGERRTLAVSIVVGVTILTIALPFLGIMALVGSEGVELSKDVVVWAQKTVSHPSEIAKLLPHWLLPRQWVETGIAQFKSRIGDVIQLGSGFLSHSVSSFTQGAIDLFLHLFVIFFGIFYFLQDGPKLIQGFIDRVPLGRGEARGLVEKTLLITIATLKSIVIVGIVQGALVGVAMAVVGLSQPWFWGAVVAVLSPIPALGAPIVYVPASLYLMLSGHMAAGIGLLAWGVCVVGVVDNVIRLHIIGRQAALPDFIVFVSTLGGLIVLGAPGVLIGPVLAGVVMGVLDLYQLVLHSSGISNELEEVTPPPPEEAKRGVIEKTL